MKALLFGNYRRGVATLEILIAFAILMLSMTAVIMVVFANQSISIDTQTNDEAVYKAEALLEVARALSRENFDLVVPIPAVTDDIYQKSLEVALLDPSIKQVTSTVTWTTMGRNLAVHLTTLLTHPTVNSCNATPAGDWKNPQHYDFPTQNLLPGNNSSGVGISDIKVYKHKLYVTATTPSNIGHTFFIFDLSTNPAVAPTYMGSINNALSTSDGLNALAVNDGYAYVTNAHDSNFQTCSQSSSCAQLQVIDISTPTAPAVVSSFKVPGVTGSGGQGIGTSIFYSKGYVYLGLAKTGSGPEFNVIDVGGGGGSASPTNPIWKGGYAVGSGINSISVSGKYAYITSPKAENMTIVDISNPSNPQRVGGYTPPAAPESNGVGSNHGKSVFSSGGTVYVGRTYGTTELYMLDVINPGSVDVTGSQDNGTGNKTSIYGIVAKGTLVFTETRTQFQVWDISNPVSIKPWTTDGTTNTFLSLAALGGSGSALNCSGDYFYLAIASSQGNNKDSISVVTPLLPSAYVLGTSGDIITTQGLPGSNTITATLVSGTPQNVSFSVTGLPLGATANFTNNSCIATCSSVLTIATSFPITPVGVYSITVKNSGGTVTTTFNLVVN